MYIFFLILIIIIAIIGFVNSINNIKKPRIVFDSLQDFKADNYFLSTSFGLSIGFDNQRKKICILDKMNKPVIFDYSKVLQCELIIDGESVLISSTSGTIGRALLGGILGGGIGAIIGGTTGSKTKKENISSIDLKIIVNDISNPVYRINFLNIKTKKGSIIYKLAYSNAEKWHGIMSGLIRQGNDDEKDIIKPVDNFSIADEIKKLKELMDNGVITEEEFSKQKSKLIDD